MPMNANQNVNYTFNVNVSDALAGLDSLDSAFSGIEKSFDNLVGATKNLAKTFGIGTKQTNFFRKALSSLSGVAIGKYLADATKEGIEYYETVNLFNVAMKDSIDEGKEFIATMSEMYGLDPKSLMDYTGLFYEMAYAVNVPQEAAEQLSMNLTRLTTDVASLFNTELDKVADNLMSGMRGMSRAVLKYGMDLRATTVEAYANANGIKAQFETMNEASREILRYVVMLDQASDAQSDFAQTIESPANQLRIFKEQASQLGRAISRFVIAPLGVALPVVNGFVAAIRVMVDTLATLFGFNYDFGSIRDAETTTDATTESITAMGDAATATGKRLNKLLAPFDELNVLAESSGGATSALGATEIDPAVLALLSEAEYKLEAIRLKAWDTRDAVLAFFGFKPTEDSWVYSPSIFEENLKQRFSGWQQTISALFDFDTKAFVSNTKLLFNSFKRIGSEAISVVTQDIERFLGIDLSDSSLASFIDNLNYRFFEFRSNLVDNESTIGKIVARVFEFGVALNTLVPIISSLTPLLVFFGALGFFASNVLSPLITGFGSLLGHLAPVVGFFNQLLHTAIYFSGSIGGLTAEFTLLGSTALAGIALLVAGFIDGFKQMWDKSATFRENISILGQNIISLGQSIVGLVVSVVGRIWDTLEPFVSGLGDLFQPIYTFVVNIVNNIVGVVTGLVDILDGLFSGDFTRVFTGLKKMIAGVVASIGEIFTAVANVVASVFLGAINFVGNLIYKFVSGVVRIINGLGKFIGVQLSVPDKSNFTVDAIPTIVAPAIDFTAFASGGVVTRPTNALIGEAGRSEAVIPLDNSPQMADLIDKIADRVGGGETVVKVYIGDREWDAFTYESAQRGSKLVGVQPIKEGRT